MTLTGPIALSTLTAIAGVLGALLVVAYILKLRRRRYEVPFSKLWQRVLRDKESSSLWRRLKRLLSLLVQLAFLALLVFAAADPKLGQASPAARSVVIIIDASASMKALDDGAGKPARLELAKQQARQLLARMGGADTAMIVRMDGQTTALSRFESDVPRLLKVVDGVEASDTPADLSRALQAAADALRGRPNPLIVLIGDGAYGEEARNEVIWERPPAAPPTPTPAPGAAAPGAAAAASPVPTAPLGKVDLTGIQVAFIPVGKEAKNVGIVAFNVRRYFQNKMSYEVLVEVQNFSTEKATVRFTLASGADTVDVKTLELAPGERLRKIYPDLGGGDDRQLTGRIETAPGPDGKAGPADAFPLDDVAYALLPERRKQRVLLVSNDNLYLEGALLLDPNITVDKLRPEEYPKELAAGTVHTHDVVVFDGFTPLTPPPTPGAIYFHPQGEKSPVPLRGEITRPFITDVEPNHPVMRWVTLSDVNIDKANVLVPRDGDVVLARSIRDPIVVAGKQDGKKFVAYGFGLDGTDLMLRVAFPVMIINSLDWFAGDDAELITTYRTGRDWHIPVDAAEGGSTVKVKEPVPGRAPVTAPVIDGRAEFYGRHVGVYQVDTGDAVFSVAANLADPLESAIKPESSITLGGKKIEGAPEFATSVTRSIWVWLILAAVALSLVEWMTYNRRITV